jgi:hypothetical protein
LGGTTGYAINPARDLGPRIVHSLLLKGNSDWSYVWVPIVGPIIGSSLAALSYLSLLKHPLKKSKMKNILIAAVVLLTGLAGYAQKTTVSASIVCSIEITSPSRLT